MSTEHKPKSSTGVGGFGNVGYDDREYIAGELEPPPELKGRYSTGRGGRANIARNDMGPEVARLSQDVEPLHYTESELADVGGRGGAGNIAVHQKHATHKPAYEPGVGSLPPRDTPEALTGSSGHVPRPDTPENFDLTKQRDSEVGLADRIKRKIFK